MKHQIVYGCGHEGVVNLEGPFTGQANRVDWLQRHGRCPECTQRLAGERQPDAPVSTSHDIYEALRQRPALRGTPSQIAWAEQLREERIKLLCGQLDFLVGEEADVLAEALTNEELRRTRRAYAIKRAAIRRLAMERSAAFWIDSRQVPLGETLRLFESAEETLLNLKPTLDKK